MDKVLAEGDVGTEAKWSVSFKDGKLLAGLVYDGKMGGASVGVSIGAKEVLEALKVAIPGKLDDAIINAIELGLGIV